MDAESRTKKTMLNTIAGFVTRIANLIARFMLQTVLIYVLGIQYVGVSGLFTSLLTILSLADLGIGSAIAYELYKPLAEKDKKKIATLMNFYKKAYRLVAIVVFVIGIVLIPFLDFFIKETPDLRENITLIYMMFIIKTVVSYLLVYKSTLLVANQQNYIVSKIQAIVTFLRTIIECIMLLLTKQYLIYLLIEIIANLGQNLWISFIADKNHPELNVYKKEKLNKNEQKKLFGDIKGLAMYKASFALGSGVDNVIVSAFVGTTAVGLLSNYILIKNELIQFLKQFYNALVPSVGNLSVTESESKQHDVFSKLMFLNFWISCFCSVSYFVLVQPFVTLWLGKQYLLSLSISAVIAIDFYLACMLETVASFRTANGIFVKGQYRPLIMVIINIVLSIILGKQLGIIGVLLATVVSRLITQWYDPYLLYKIVFKCSPKRFYFRYYAYMLLFIVCAMLSYLVVDMIAVNNLLGTLACRMVVCMIVPNVVIILIYRKTDEFMYCCSQLNRVFVKAVNKMKK